MLIVLGIILLVLMGCVGGDRGLMSFVSLVGNIIVIMICVYGIMCGANIIVMTFICSILFIVITLFYQNGKNIKTVAAFFSVISVEILLSVVIGIIVYCSKLAGYNEIYIYEESNMSLSVDLNLNMEMLMVAVVLIAVLGAIMDTSIAISSSVFEISQNNMELTISELRKSGKNVGKDILGTTANTLFLAGIGETTMLSMLMVKNGYTFERLINSKALFQEIIVILFANIGCLLIIPITVWVISFIIKSDRKESSSIREYCLKVEKEIQ